MGLDQRRSWLGGAAVTLSAVVGTSIFVSITQAASVLVAIIVGLMSVTASVLVALQAYLDYGRRAERNRLAAVHYKAVIRKLEQVLTGTLASTDSQDARFDELRQRLDSLEEEMPVIDWSIKKRMDDEYKNARFVAKAIELAEQTDAITRPS